MKYICDRCNKEFMKKGDWTRHKNRKNPCKLATPINTNLHQNNTGKKVNKIHKIIINDTDINECKENEYVCKYCNKIFTRNWTLYRHVDERCKIKKQRENEKEIIFNELRLKLEKLERSNEELRKEVEMFKKPNKNIKTINNNKTQNNTVNNIGNTIVLIGYGKEDMTKIDKNDIIRSLKGFNTPLKLTETVHFNSKYPEYHNVYISNMKDKYAMIYEGKQWSLITKTELIDKLYDDKKSYIEDNFEEFCEKLTHSQRRAMDRWLNIDDEDPKVKAIKEDIKLLLYNKRDIPIQTKELNMIAEN